MKFRVGGDNRNGSVSVKGSGKGDPREDSYNVDPGQGRYKKIARTLAERAAAGSGTVSATLETYSEFLGYANNECTGFAFKSKGTIVPPADPQATALGLVQESIWMNFRVEQPGKVQLKASVESDLDIAEVFLQGPAFAKPVRIYDDYDKALDLDKPGEYSLRGGYRLSVQFPNSGLGGRPLTVEIEARLIPTSS
jgi:hypothetical protein